MAFHHSLLPIWIHITVWCHYNVVSFPPNIYNKHPIVRVILWMQASFDLCSASITAVMGALSCIIALRYNGTPLYNICISNQIVRWKIDLVLRDVLLFCTMLHYQSNITAVRNDYIQCFKVFFVVIWNVWRPFMAWHIEAETKWLPFRRQHFQIHFHKRKCLNLD